MADVEPFVALQTNEIRLQRRRGRRRQRGLTHAGFAFEKERPLEAKRQKQRNRETAVGDVVVMRGVAAAARRWIREKWQ